MEAPEKIYLQPLENNEIYNHWYSLKLNNNFIEYTRTEAFIEKGCDMYCKVCGHYAHTTPSHICRQACDYFIKFRNYMKGE